MLRPLIFNLLLLSPLLAEIREWRSDDGSRTFTGEFVSREDDQITIKREDGNTVTFAITRLHPEDREWINQHHSAKPAEIEKSAAFGNLVFGDTRDEVYSKLEESLLVNEGEMPAESAFGSIDFDKKLRTREKLGGLECFIRFGWNDAGLLSEITMTTESLPGTEYQSTLRKAWGECAELLNHLHGKPLHAAGYPDPRIIREGFVTGSHIWKIEQGGSAIVGLVQEEEEKYAIIIRFSEEEAKVPQGR